MKQVLRQQALCQLMYHRRKIILYYVETLGEDFVNAKTLSLSLFLCVKELVATFPADPPGEQNTGSILHD